MNKLFFFLPAIIFTSITYSQTPKFLWAKQMGIGTGWSIAVDPKENVYTTGGFVSTADFDPGTGTYNLTSIGYDDIFVSKLDANGNFLWVKQMGGKNSDISFSIAVDADGNVYTTGYFSDTVDFNPGIGTYNLSSDGGNDIFVSKLDASGNFLWAKRMGGTNPDISLSIAIDVKGNVYTTGGFIGTVDFDPGTGTYNLTSGTHSPSSTRVSDIFVSKLDASGNFLWAKQLGGVNTAQGSSIAIDTKGNVYTTGFFAGTIDFDPGPGAYNLTSNRLNLFVSIDIFVSKLDASGNFLWAKQLGVNSHHPSYIAVDAKGSVYTTGEFFGTFDFDPGPDTLSFSSGATDDIFVSKLDSNGNFHWAKKMGGNSGINPYSIAVDTNGSIYITGGFGGIVDFDPGAETYNLSADVGSIFISKIGTAGNFLWAVKVGRASTGHSIVVDAKGNIYTIGRFSYDVDFDPGPGVYNLSSGAGDNIFVSKFSASGN